jgi:hypothetical protein
MPKAAGPERVSASDWVKTRTQHLHRHSKSGRYYVRAYRQGREVWKALGTISCKVAKGNTRETLKEIQKNRTLTDAFFPVNRLLDKWAANQVWNPGATEPTVATGSARRLGATVA